MIKKQKDVDIAVWMVSEAKCKFAALSSCSFDKGFFSSANKLKLQDILDYVVLPNKGGISECEKQVELSEEFVSTRHKHAAVESEIDAFEKHGLDRFRDRSKI